MGKKVLSVDQSKIDRFWKSRTKVEDTRVSTHFKDDDTHLFDLNLIKEYCSLNTRVLDLACGTGCHTNAIAHLVKSVKAVDKYDAFLRSVSKVDNVTTKQSDLLDFHDTNSYDLVLLLLGIMNYFDDDQARAIYQKAANLVEASGTVIVKHACGVKEDVLVDSYSKEIGDNYYALYRHLEREIALLEEFFTVDIINIYPKRLNPWENTHFYAFVCKRI